MNLEHLLIHLTQLHLEHLWILYFLDDLVLLVHLLNQHHQKHLELQQHPVHLLNPEHLCFL